MPGEDPFLTSQYVLNYVRGMQSDSLDPLHLKVACTCKHLQMRHQTRQEIESSLEQAAQRAFEVSAEIPVFGHEESSERIENAFRLDQ